MNKLLLLLTISTLVLFACESPENSCSDFAFVDSTISNTEDYLIIKAIINEQFSNSNLSHISQETHFIADSSQFSLYFKEEDLELEADLIELYIATNSVPANWGNSFDTAQDLISEEELVCLFENDGWIGFYEKYPDSDGIFRFGKPVQNNENEALVSFEYLCGAECSSGYTAALIKENGEWKVRKLAIVWVG